MSVLTDIRQLIEEGDLVSARAALDAAVRPALGPHERSQLEAMLEAATPPAEPEAEEPEPESKSRGKEKPVKLDDLEASN